MALQLVLCIALLLSMAAAGAARPPVTPQTPVPPPAAFGSANASVSQTTQLRDSLSVATVEAGTSRAPRPVQQAYLASASDGRPAAGGNQTAGFGGFPWTPSNTSDPNRGNPSQLAASSEAIIESDGTVPQCEVTVQLSPLTNGSDGSVATVLNLIYTNWDSVAIPTPWTTTVINNAYRRLLDSANIEINVAVQRVLQGTVTSANASLPANGSRSVPITFILEAAAGPDLVPTAVFQNGRKCMLVNVGGAAFVNAKSPAAGGGGTERAETPVRLSGPNIIGVDGNVLAMKGLNWFGFDDGVTALEGLWFEGDALSRDLATITQRIRLLGFNAIRLPFSMQDLFNLSPKSIDAACNFPSNTEVLQSVTKPSSGRRLLQASGACTDTSPSSWYTCAQQAGWGQCSQSFMQGFCMRSCGRCTTPAPTRAPAKAPSPAAGSCNDNSPSPSYTCAQQAGWGQCSQGFMQGFCDRSCGRCTTPAATRAPTKAPTKAPSPAPAGSCTDTPPSPSYTCTQQKAWGQCNQAFMQGFCSASCGRCTTPAPTSAPTKAPIKAPSPSAGTCLERPLPGPYTCAQQKAWGKCDETYMAGYCDLTCGRCSQAPTGAGCMDKPTPGYTCAQQKTFGQCSAGFMTQGNYCAQTCGRCSGAPAPTPAPTAPVDNTAAISVGLPFPPTGGSAGICNSYMPSDTTFNRLMYIVQFFARNGFYLLLDNQFNFDTTAITDQNAWVQGWKRIANAVNADATISNRVFYDVLNEPDAFGVRFEPQNGRPGMKDLYFAAFDAIYSINPASVFVIEGLGQQSYGSLNWGDGLIIDPSIISQFGLSDPNPFFKELLTKPYRRQVVVGVHIYPPAISKSNTKYTAEGGLYQRLTLSFGYLNKRGYCNGGDCQVFPIMLGEFGSAMHDDRDLQWLNDLVAYMKNTGAGADGQHSAIDSWFWWAWPTNSGDTKGIVDSNWVDILWQKVDYLEQLGLVPWYRRG